jgi:hypothetical protein
MQSTSRLTTARTDPRGFDVMGMFGSVAAALIVLPSAALAAYQKLPPANWEKMPFRAQNRL